MHASTPHLYCSRGLPGPRVIIALLVTLFAWLAPPSHAQPRDLAEAQMATVPNVVGMPFETARATLRSAGLHGTISGLVVKTTDASKNLTVLRQEPAPGTRVAATSPLKIWSYRYEQSAAPAGAAVMPSILGMTQLDAQRAITNAGLKSRRSGPDVATTDRTRNMTVARQNPQPGAQVPAGGTVEFWLYGLAQVTVPNVVHMETVAAGAALNRAGLRAEVKQEVTTYVAQVGKVIRQSPAAGASAYGGATVQIFVGVPVPKTRMPNLVGMSLANARAALAQAGLQGQQVRPNVPTPDRARHGTIARHVPSAGTEVATGAIVHVWFYEFQGPAPVTAVRVPIVLAMSEADARRALTAAGLNPVIQRQKTPLPNRWGQVMAQSPSGGATLAKGANVTIVIGVQ